VLLGSLKSDLQITKCGLDHTQFSIGAEEMKAPAHNLLPIGGVDEYGWNASVSARWEAIIAEGLLDAGTLAKAKEERDQWYQDERAFGFYVFVFVAGQA
jgi:hypothetical protein